MEYLSEHRIFIVALYIQQGKVVYLLHLPARSVVQWEDLCTLTEKARVQIPAELTNAIQGVCSVELYAMSVKNKDTRCLALPLLLPSAGGRVQKKSISQLKQRHKWVFSSGQCTASAVCSHFF